MRHRSKQAQLLAVHGGEYTQRAVIDGAGATGHHAVIGAIEISSSLTGKLPVGGDGLELDTLQEPEVIEGQRSGQGVAVSLV